NHEVDGLWRDELGSHDEIAFVFAIFFVNQNDDAAGAQFADDLGNRGNAKGLRGSVGRNGSKRGRHENDHSGRKTLSLPPLATPRPDPGGHVAACRAGLNGKLPPTAITRKHPDTRTSRQGPPCKRLQPCLPLLPQRCVLCSPISTTP